MGIKVARAPRPDEVPEFTERLHMVRAAAVSGGCSRAVRGMMLAACALAASGVSMLILCVPVALAPDSAVSHLAQVLFAHGGQ